MSLPERVAAVLRPVRGCALALLLSLAPAHVALQEFDTHYGVPTVLEATASCDEVGCDEARPDVARVVRGLETNGLACSSVPRLSDDVVLERTDGELVVVTLAEAVRGATARTARVHAYCAAP